MLLGDKLQQTLEDHYNSFITEEDIAQIAGAGLNWVRLPIPFWAIEKWNDVGVDGTGATISEPFLARTCWNFGIRVDTATILCTRSQCAMSMSFVRVRVARSVGI
ncbi:hypothetical protein OH76DRAFT_1424132 [Lentinus brumalis]|uniref:glucan 1,3-beta-glucosidase n=1 Tax=Lentinus brumalis TaxID=2498619 RepID=A0A371CHF7_9APHY|nr:hypothetical protein OH76DRAFT_1424132 [Polyporus brumalis]